MKKVYCVYHCVDHEGSDLVGVYASHSRARDEAVKLEKQHFAVKSARWATMSKSEQNMWGTFNTFAFSEHWQVDEHEVIE
jgi:hypothetical protein